MLTCVVPQVSALGPILFILYTADLLALIEKKLASALTYTLTICKFMAGTDRRMSPTCNCACLTALMTSHCGWGRIACNLTPTKLT